MNYIQRKVRVGFVGVNNSGMPKRFAECMKDDFKNLALVSAWDENGGKCKEFCELFNIDNQADSAEAVGKEVDLIIMDLKPCDTAPVAKNFIRLGVSLYISKPLANNLDNGLQILQAARATGTPLLCTSTMRYETGTQEVASKVRKGELGNIHFVFIAFHHSVNGYLTPENEWHVSLKGGGGPLFYLGVHALDILEEIIGLDDIDWVSNCSGILAHKDYPVFKNEAIGDTDAINIRYGKGIQATLHIGSGVDYYYYGGQIAGHKSHCMFSTKNDYHNTIEKIITMALTKKSPLPLESMERVIRVLDLAFRSGKEKRQLKYGA